MQKAIGRSPSISYCNVASHNSILGGNVNGDGGTNARNEKSPKNKFPLVILADLPTSVAWKTKRLSCFFLKETKDPKFEIKSTRVEKYFQFI